MAIVSALVFDTFAMLDGIPATSAPKVVSLQNGGFALVASSDFFTILRIFDAEGQTVRSVALPGTDATLATNEIGEIAVGTLNEAAQRLTVTVFDLGGAHLRTNTYQDIRTTNPEILYKGVLDLPEDEFGVHWVVDYPSDTDIRTTSIGGTPGQYWLERSTAQSAGDFDTAILSTGEFVSATEQVSVGSGEETILVNIFDRTTFSGGSFAVNATALIDFAGNPGTVRNPSVVAFDGGFAVAFEGRPFSFIATQDIFVRFFDNAGNVLRTENVSNPLLSTTFSDDGSDDRDPHLSVGPDGNVIVTWTRERDGTTDQMIALVTEDAMPGAQVGFGNRDNAQETPVTAFFGVGNVAAFHFDAETNTVTGEWLVGERDTAGDELDNLLEGDDFRDLMNGLDGNDTIRGGRNDDTLQGGDGSDSIYGGDGDDEIVGEEGVGANGSGAHHDHLFGENGRDSISGEDGNDTLNGGNGSDTLDGGNGNDLIVAGNGDDLARGGNGRDTMNGGEGADALFGDIGADSLNGGSENDTLEGGNGRDTLIGGRGNDLLDGGERDDVLDGGSGRDTMTGGEGADDFLFSASLADAGVDTITDFATGIDQIGLRAMRFSSVAGGVSAGNLASGGVAQDADDFLLYNQNRGLLRYDADGNGAGKAVLIAELAPGTAVDFTDFFVF